MGKPLAVQGPDGKTYVFPEGMTREAIRDVLRGKYPKPLETPKGAAQYLAGVEQKARVEEVRKENTIRRATEEGRKARAAAAEKMGLESPLMMAVGSNALSMAERGASGAVMEEGGYILPDEAAGLSAANAAAFWVPGMVNDEFGARLDEARRQEPGAALVGDVAGGYGPGEAIMGGIFAAGKGIARVAEQIGAKAKLTPAQVRMAEEIDWLEEGLTPSEGMARREVREMIERIRPRIQKQIATKARNKEQLARAMEMFAEAATPAERAMLGLADPPAKASVAAAPAKADIKPMGFGGASRPSIVKRQTRDEPFYDERLGARGSITHKAVEMRRNGYTVREIADEMDTSEESIRNLISAAKQKGVDVGALAKDRVRDDILALKERGLTTAQIAERLQIKPNNVASTLSQERKKLGANTPDWLKPNRQMGADVQNAAIESTFGSVGGSAAGGQTDLTGDGKIDEMDAIAGGVAGGIGLPLALAGARQLGQMFRARAQKPPLTLGPESRIYDVDEQRLVDSLRDPRMAEGDPLANAQLLDEWDETSVTPQGFGAQEQRSWQVFNDPRLSPGQNKAVEMRTNGFTTEEIAEEMDTSTSVVLKHLSEAKRKGVEFPKIRLGGPQTMTPRVLKIAARGLRPVEIAEQIGSTHQYVSVLLSKERARLRKAGKPIPDWLKPRDPGGNIKETD